MRAVISHWYLCTPGCCQHISYGPAMLQTSIAWKERDFLQVGVITASVISLWTVQAVNSLPGAVQQLCHFHKHVTEGSCHNFVPCDLCSLWQYVSLTSCSLVVMTIIFTFHLKSSWASATVSYVFCPMRNLASEAVPSVMAHPGCNHWYDSDISWQQKLKCCTAE